MYIGIYILKFIRVRTRTHTYLWRQVSLCRMSRLSIMLGSCRTHRGFSYHISRSNSLSFLLDTFHQCTYLDPHDTSTCLNPCHVCTCLDPTIIHHAKLLYARDGNRANNFHANHKGHPDKQICSGLKQFLGSSMTKSGILPQEKKERKQTHYEHPT